MSLLEIAGVLSHSGLNLPIAYDSEEIGNTGLRVPFNIDLFSTPYNAGQPWLRINQGRPWIKIDGRDVFGGNYAAGYHLAVVDPHSGRVDTLGAFDTWSNRDDNRRMASFIDGVPTGKVVVAVVNDEASANLTADGVLALRRIGTRGDLRGRHRWAHVIAGVKGAAPGTAAEMMSRYAIRGTVLGGNIERAPTPGPGNRVLLLSGKFPDYHVQAIDALSHGIAQPR